jgi:hypothetical protein
MWTGEIVWLPRAIVPSRTARRNLEAQGPTQALRSRKSIERQTALQNKTPSTPHSPPPPAARRISSAAAHSRFKRPSPSFLPLRIISLPEEPPHRSTILRHCSHLPSQLPITLVGLKAAPTTSFLRSPCLHHSTNALANY